MPVLELLSSGAAVCSIILLIAVYAFYYETLDRFSTQMQLAGTRPLDAAMVTTTGDVSKGQASVRQRALEGFNLAKARAAFAPRQGKQLGPLGQPFGANAITDKFGAAFVFTTDTSLENVPDFHVPVKVAGDLTIDGHVAFHETVVVDGTLFVRGHAEFLGGVLAKGEVVIDGLVTIDGRSRNNWLVGYRLRGSGILAVSESKRSEDILEAAL